MNDLVFITAKRIIAQAIKPLLVLILFMFASNRILAAGNGTPLFYLHQPKDTIEGQICNQMNAPSNASGYFVSPAKYCNLNNVLFYDGIISL